VNLPPCGVRRAHYLSKIVDIIGSARGAARQRAKIRNDVILSHKVLLPETTDFTARWHSMAIPVTQEHSAQAASRNSPLSVN
jgi:hypothetical protein